MMAASSEGIDAPERRVSGRSILPALFLVSQADSERVEDLKHIGHTLVERAQKPHRKGARDSNQQNMKLSMGNASD